MNRLSLNLKSLQRFAATMLLAAMVFQLGACPCGCIEHNAWLQLIGFDAADGDQHLAVANSDSGEVLSASVCDSHDCTGESRPQFVDNARSPRPQGTVFIEPLSPADPCTLMLDVSTASVKSCLFDPAQLPVDAALARPALQVFRL